MHGNPAPLRCPQIDYFITGRAFTAAWQRSGATLKDLASAYTEQIVELPFLGYQLLPPVPDKARLATDERAEVVQAALRLSGARPLTMVVSGQNEVSTIPPLQQAILGVQAVVFIFQVLCKAQPHTDALIADLLTVLPPSAIVLLKEV